jgi:hypothetical protein
MVLIISEVNEQQFFVRLTNTLNVIGEVNRY